MEELRYNLRPYDLKVTWVKTAPTRYAMKSSPLHGHKGLDELLKDQISVAYSDALEVDMKSVLKVIKANQYAKLPSLQKSREELVGILSQPSQTMLRLLQTN